MGIRDGMEDIRNFINDIRKKMLKRLWGFDEFYLVLEELLGYGGLFENILLILRVEIIRGKDFGIFLFLKKERFNVSGS